MKKVLILEDNAPMLEHLSGIVQGVGMRVETFPFDNAKDASYCALKNTIDLFIIDIILEPH